MISSQKMKTKTKTVEGEDEEGDEDELNVSLSVMEEKLAPRCFEISKIEKTYKKMQKVQQERLDALQKGEEPAEATNKKYNALVPIWLIAYE